MEINSPEFKELTNASDDELMSLLGLYAIPLVQGPGKALLQAREGRFFSGPPALLGSGQGRDTFRHEAFQKLGHEFLKQWAKAIQKAICHNGNLSKQLENKTYREIDIIVASVVGALAAQIPQLASLNGLLIILGVMIARSGITAFCKTIESL
jgi:hypothetical protein